MQTIYYTTSNYIRHTGNVVDFAEYRRRMARTAVPTAEEPMQTTDELARMREECPRRSRAGGLFLDYCASGAIVLMTVVVVAQFLI